MGVGLKIRRLLVVSTKRCCRLICGHPFLVGMACFLFLLYRSSPWLFSLLVSASPVLVCTALLLGALLSFGQPNIPEIEREEETFSHEIALLKANRLENVTVVARNEDYFLESLTREKKNETKERVVNEGTSVDGGGDVIEEDDSLHKNVWPVGNTSRDIEFEKPLLRESVTEYSEVEENDISVNDERIGTEGVSGSREEGEDRNRLIEEVYHTIKVENRKDKREPSDDHLEIQSESQWKEIDDDDDDDDDVSVDSCSDHAESSSPDASMVDIRPMLDELDPLLDEEELLMAGMTHEHSDIASEHSDEFKSKNLESDEDSQNEEAVNDDDMDDLEEEEEAQGGNDGESKSVITWTEDDQKNLMDMGTSELERNQRLEKLIAGRLAKKSMGLMAEKNLIDLDSNDLPFNVPPIATTRRNPFDGTDDSCNNVGLPPIPGSAPSIMLQRRNPFDLPYGPNEEKPDLKGDSFQQEFTLQQQRDAIFRRHESFSSGPSNMGMFRQEKQDVKWRPYFVPEHFTADGLNYHPFQRQSSEVSDSKASSGPDTESVASMTPGHLTADGRNYHPFQRQSSEVSDSKGSSGDTESMASMTDQDNRNINEQDFSKEAKAVSSLGRASLSVEEGTESSEDFDSPNVEEGEKNASLRDENVIMIGNAETQEEPESSFSEAMNTSFDSITNETQEEPESSFSEAMNASFDSITNETQEEAESSFSEAMNASFDSITNETQEEPETSFSEAMNISLDSITSESPSSADTVYEESSSKSSTSFYSEVNELVADVKREETSSPTTDLGVKSHFTNEHKGEDVNLSFPRGAVDDNLPQEPVYDSSPPAIDGFHSFSSFPAGMQVDVVEMDTSIGVVQNSSDKTEGESMPKNVLDYDKMFASASLLNAKSRNGFSNQEVTDLMEDDMHEARPSLANGELGNQSGQETSIEPVSTNSSSPPSWDESIVEGTLHRRGSRDEHNNINLPSFDAETVDASHHPLGKHQDGFTSPTSLKEAKFSGLERLPSNGIEHAPTIDVDLGTKEEGVDLTETLTARLGETHLSATDGPIQESMELNVDGMQHEKDKLLSDVRCKMYDPFPQDQVKERDVTTSNQRHVLSEETELSLHDEQKVYLGEERVLVIGPGSSPDCENADDHLNVQQEDIRDEHPLYSSDVKEDASLTQGVDLKAVNIPSQGEQSRLEDLQNQETSIIKEESAVEGKGVNENETQEIPESSVTSLSDNTTASPQSVHTSDGTFEFLSPTWTAYYSDDSVHGITSGVHARVLEQSEHLKESSESVGDFRVRESIDRSVEGELPLAADHVDEIDLPYSPSEPGESGSSFHDIETKSIEDITQAFRHIHGRANADAKMVSESSSIDLDHGDSKDQVEENSDFHEPQLAEVTGFHEETADDVAEFPQVREHSHGLTMMKANEINSSGCVNTTNVVAAAVIDPEMIDSSLSLPILEARYVEDINTAFERLREGANVEDVILPSSMGDQTSGSEPQVIEPRSLDDIKQISADDEDQRLDNMHSQDRLAEDVASEAKNLAEPSNATIAESDLEETRSAIVGKAEVFSESDGCSSMPDLETSSTGDTGMASEQSNKQADAVEFVLSPVNNDLGTGEFDGQDGSNSSVTKDLRSNEIIHLPENQTVEADQDALHREVDIGNASAVFEPAGEAASQNAKSGILELDLQRL